jgi:hypothetical protein
LTLALCVVNPHGAWQTSDTRLFDANLGKPIPDPSTKQFTFMTPDGAGTIAYTGIGWLSPDQHVSGVIFKLLRGMSADVESTLAAIAAFATDRIAPIALKHGVGHTFVACGFRNRVPWLAAISNDATALYHDRVLRVGNPKAKSISAHFVPWFFKDTGTGVSVVAGMHGSVSNSDYEILKRIMTKRPERADEFLRLLAEITRRTGKHAPNYISEESYGVRINPTGRAFPPHAFTWGKPADQGAMPKSLLWGLDPSSAAEGLSVGIQAAAGDEARIKSAFVAALRTMMEISVGQRVVHNKTGRRGTVVNSFADPDGDVNLVSVRWDGDAKAQSADRADFAILPPGVKT